MSKLKVEVIVGLINQLSGPLRSVSRDLRRAGAEIGVIGASAALAGKAILDPILDAVKASGQLSSALTEVGIVANESAARMGALRPELRAIGRESNQFAQDLAGGLKDLTAKGMSLPDAIAALPAIAKTTTAAHAELTDMASTASSLIQNLGILPTQLQRSLDILTAAGNEGAFELKDMAKEFPVLTAATAKLGLTGERAVATLGAALQVAMKGAGSAPEAANNLLNLMLKLTAPETVKNMSKQWGVDLPAAFQRWQREGLNPVEESLRLIQEKTGGDAFKMGEVFGDMQVLGALTPLLQNMDEYRRIKALSENAMGASQAQFARRMAEDPTERWKQLSIQVANLADRLGVALLPVLERIAQTLVPILDRVGAWIDANPELAATIGIATAALGAVLVVAGPLVMGLGAMIGGLSLAGIAFGILLTPLGLTVAAIMAVVGAFLYFREKIVAWVVDAAEQVARIAKRITDPFDALPGRFGEIGGAIIRGLIAGIVGGVPALMNQMMGIAAAAATKVREVLGVHSPSRVFAGIGANLVRGLEVGIQARKNVPATLLAGLIALPAAAPPGPRAGGGIMFNMPITIQAQPGMDAQALAALVRREVEAATRQGARRIAALYDGSDGL